MICVACALCSSGQESENRKWKFEIGKISPEGGAAAK